MNWIFSEQMLVYYISVFRDAFWPDGKLAPPTTIRSEQQSQQTKQRAQQKLLENIPGEALVPNPKCGEGRGKAVNPVKMYFIYICQELLLTMRSTESISFRPSIVTC